MTSAVRGAYLSNTGPVAYLDESYSVDPAHPHKFYIMSAVVVEPDQRDLLRSEIVAAAGSSWWHTTDALRSEDGRLRTHAMLTALADPAGTEWCVIAHRRAIEPGDVDGEEARAAALTALLAHLATGSSPVGDPVSLFVLERRRERRQANRDARTKAQAVADGVISARTSLLQVTPAEEQLLWLPDVVCSAYRQQVVRGDSSYFSHIEAMTTLLEN